MLNGLCRRIRESSHRFLLQLLYGSYLTLWRSRTSGLFTRFLDELCLNRSPDLELDRCNDACGIGAENNFKKQSRTTRGGFNLLLFSTAFEEFWHRIFWATSQLDSHVLSGYGAKTSVTNGIASSQKRRSPKCHVAEEHGQGISRLATDLQNAVFFAFGPSLAPRLTP